MFWCATFLGILLTLMTIVAIETGLRERWLPFIICCILIAAQIVILLSILFEA